MAGRRSGRTAALSVVALAFAAFAAGGGSFVAHAATPPATPTDVELTANSDSSISIAWAASAGATSYNIYRGTASNGEGTVPIATTSATTYRDSNLSSTPIYFYQLTAVNAGGESARTAEDASKTPPPIGTGGDVAGVAAGSGKVYYCEDALLGGFDWFQTLTGWFPSVLGSSGSNSPGQRVVDMAYSTRGTVTFNNVVVPTSGLYTVDWRYAFQSGLFPGVTNRQMGLMVNGNAITTTQRFPITGSFNVYQHSALQVQLHAGTNSVSQFAVPDHGLSRVDQMTVTPATASVPSGPTNLSVAVSGSTVTLSWTPSASGSSTSYTIYRGTKSDGEAVTPIATTNGTTTMYTSTGVLNGTYFYNIAANNAVGISPSSNEVSVTVGSSDTTAPSAPAGLSASGTTATATNLSWSASTDNVGVSGYDVLRNGASIATVAGTSFTASLLTASTPYTFQVEARDAAGNVSAGSNTVSVTTSAGNGATNLSQGKPTTASSVQLASTPAANATDGNLGTRWSSAASDPQWLQVDLGATHSVTQVVLTWETAYGKAFTIQTSPDGTANSWTTVTGGTVTNGTGGVQTLAVTGSGRFVRMNGTARGTGFGYSLWEFQVFGS